jgi:hypothetical protein
MQQQVSPAPYYPAAAPQSGAPQQAIQAQTHTNTYSGPLRPSQADTQTKSVTSSMKKFLKSSKGKKVALVGGGVLVGAAALMGLDLGDSIAEGFGGGDLGTEYASGEGEFTSGGGEYTSGGGEYTSGNGGLADASQLQYQPGTGESCGAYADPGVSATTGMFDSNMDSLAFGNEMSSAAASAAMSYI